MVDILLATYNGEKFIEQQIKSLFSQTYQNFKIIIRDDGSTDGTIKIIESYVSKYPDKVFLVKDQFKDKNAKDNFFRLLNYSDSDYIMFCDQDDIWLDNKIEITLNEMVKICNENGIDKPVLVHTDLMVVDEWLSVLKESFFIYQGLNKRVQSFNEALSQNNVTGCTVMINKECKLYLKDYINKNILMHDWWLSLICSCFGIVHFIDKPTILYRQHENNTVGAKENIKTVNISNIYKYIKDIKKIKKNYLGIINQGEFFYNIYKNELEEEALIFLVAFSNLKKVNIFKKIYILQKYRFWKKGLIKNIGQIFIC
ncbi:MAG: glycosyltransferase family 2 protein [Oscillospiraceae bacterium]